MDPGPFSPSITVNQLAQGKGIKQCSATLLRGNTSTSFLAEGAFFLARKHNHEYIGRK